MAQYLPVARALHFGYNTANTEYDHFMFALRKVCQMECGCCGNLLPETSDVQELIVQFAQHLRECTKCDFQLVSYLVCDLLKILC